jgi:hypothetical protein
MKTHIVKLGFCLSLSLLPVLVQGEDERPALKESPAKLVNLIETIGRENYAAARVNVARDAAHKKLRIFSIMTSVKTGEIKVSGYDLEIIYTPDIASTDTGVICYRFQNNNQILSFAAAQFTSGNKAFAKRLVGILAEAEPDLFWSSPTDPALTIKQILAALERDNETLKHFLTDESETWAETVKKYGP